MASVRFFISAVSDEFGSYRDEVRRTLTRPNVEVKIQEDFKAGGTFTLLKLDEYIAECDTVIHLVGDKTGAIAQEADVAALFARHPDLEDRLPALQGAGPFAYTQWEAYLALYYRHRDHAKRLIVAVPERGSGQRAHLDRLAELVSYPEIRFKSVEDMCSQLLGSAVMEILTKAGAKTKPMNLPYGSLGDLFKGREDLLVELRASLTGAGGGQAAIVGRAVHGLGGVGKTRLAVEYALRHADEYTALLFAIAETPEELRRNLAALCGPLILDLPEQDVKEEQVRFNAVIRWLQQNPGWLLILDNADTPDAARTVEELLAHLHGGHVLITSRRPDWSAQIGRFELDLLALEDAVDLLLSRTEGRRRKAANDAELAKKLATELGRLALALEQAGAYIAKNRLSFTDYLDLWEKNRSKAMEWFDEQLMKYPRSMAVTWQTSVGQLSEPALDLLHRLSWLAPDPIPESLLTTGDEDLLDALAELESYSLVNRSSDSPTFTVHRLIQDVTRRSLGEDDESLIQTLLWLDDAFMGDPGDVRTWATLKPLAVHVVSADRQAGLIAEPIGRLLNQVGLLLKAQGLYREAEPLMRRSVEIGKRSLSPDHPKVVTRVGNLALLLRETNRPAEAEPLMRWALEIDEGRYGR